MRVKSDRRPEETEVEVLDNGAALVFLRENITDVIEPPNGAGQDQTRPGFEYDEYTVETNLAPGLLERVEQNRASWLAAAKGKEADASAPSKEEQEQQRKTENDAILLDLDFRTTLLENGLNGGDLT